MAFSQTLEIHQMSVGHGDGALIVVRDAAVLEGNITSAGFVVPADKTEMLKFAIDRKVPLIGTVLKAVLIDGGDNSKQATKINAYINTMGINQLDYVIASHYHQDHIGGIPGIISSNPSANGLDRGDTHPVPSKKVGKKGVSVYGKYINSVTTGGMTRTTVALGGTVALNGVGLDQIQLLCIAKNNYVLGENPAVAAPRKGTDQNDLGIAWILQYGNFRFYTGGDLGGWKTGGYIDMESPLADSLKARDKAQFKWTSGGADIPKGHVCAIKLSHHGSTYSTSEYFLSVLLPIVGVISCGEKHGHPNQEVIEALERKISPKWDVSTWTKKAKDSVINSVQKYYLTALLAAYDDNPRKNIGDPALSNGVIGGDIVIIVNDDDRANRSRFTVYWNGLLPGTLVSRPMRKPNAAGLEKFECHTVKTAAADLVYIK